MQTYTQYLKLLKESDDELIDQFAVNWPILETAAGPTPVGAGVIPPDSELYHGKMIYEPSTGKYWVAYKNPTSAGFVQKWLAYPWMANAFRNAQSLINSTANTTIVTNATTASQNVNWTPVHPIVTPVDGIYSVDYQATFNMASGTAGIEISYGASSQPQSAYFQSTDGAANYFQGAEIRRIAANTTVEMLAWQASGATINGQFLLTVELLEVL